MKTKEVVSVNKPFKRIIVNNTLVLKLHIKYFKEFSSQKERYGQYNLHFVYMKICGPFPPHCDMNYFIEDGYVYIAPESGLGVEEDLNVLVTAMDKK